MRDVLTDGDLWSWTRSVMSQGADIRADYDTGKHNGYEAYSARLDAAASERAAELYNARILPALQAAARLGAERERATMDAALDLLETMYRLWENGVDCYLDVEDQTGYLGKAVDLDDLTERKIADLLNEHRPANPTLDDAAAIRRGEEG